MIPFAKSKHAFRYFDFVKVKDQPKTPTHHKLDPTQRVGAKKARAWLVLGEDMRKDHPDHEFCREWCDEKQAAVQAWFKRVEAATKKKVTIYIS